MRLQFGGLLLRVDSMADNDETFAMLGTDKAWLWAQAQHSESKEGTSEQLVSVRVVDDKPWASHAYHCLLP